MSLVTFSRFGEKCPFLPIPSIPAHSCCLELFKNGQEYLELCKNGQEYLEMMFENAQECVSNVLDCFKRSTKNNPLFISVRVILMDVTSKRTMCFMDMTSKSKRKNMYFLTVI